MWLVGRVGGIVIILNIIQSGIARIPNPNRRVSRRSIVKHTVQAMNELVIPEYPYLSEIDDSETE